MEEKTEQGGKKQRMKMWGVEENVGGEMSRKTIWGKPFQKGRRGL